MYPKPPGLIAAEQRFRTLFGKAPPRHQWATILKPEDEVTGILAAMINPTDHPTLAHYLVQSICKTLPEPLGSHIAGFTWLWACTFGDGFGPDLVLTDRKGVARVVIEHKRGAPSNTTTLGAVERAGALFDDRLARLTWKLVNQWRVRERHPPSTECCHRHTGTDEHGLAAAGMWQIDAYRITPGWAPAPMTLPSDPLHVAWILLDAKNRTIDEAYEGAITAKEWHVISHAALAEILLDYIEEVAARDVDLRHPSFGKRQVEEALSALFTDGPGARDRWLT